MLVARFSRFSRFLGGASRGRAGAWCGITAGEHARSFWLIRASRPIHQSCPRTTVCADVMHVGSRSRVGIPAPAWSRQIKDRLNGVAPYRYPPATSSRFHGHLQWMESQFTCTGRRRSLFFVRGLSSYRSSINSNSAYIYGCWVSQKYPGTCISFRRTHIRESTTSSCCPLRPLVHRRWWLTDAPSGASTTLSG